MIAFHGDAQLKADILAELAEHRAQDQIIKGAYGRGSNGDWKGCAVGCSIHSLNRKRGTSYSVDSHVVYEEGFGIPRQLAYLEDIIFERLPEPNHLEWPGRFMRAIKPGADLSRVNARFMLWMLADPKEGVIRFTKEGSAQHSSVVRVAALYERLLLGSAVSREEWAAAAAAAVAAVAAAEGLWEVARNHAYVRMAEKLVELLEAA